MTATPETFGTTDPTGPRSWRDRPTYLALEGLVRAGLAGEPLEDVDLAETLEQAAPNDPAAYARDLIAVATEAVELREQGRNGDARELVRTRAEEIDEKYATSDARRDQAAKAKDDRQAARSASVDPAALAKDVPRGVVR